jgi:hypothetical protein
MISSFSGPAGLADVPLCALSRFSLDPSPELAVEGGKPSIIRVLPLFRKMGAKRP